MAQVDIKNCSFTLKDGNSHTLEWKVGDGTMSFRMRRNLIFTKNRGKLDLVKIGDDIPVEVSFDVVIEFLTAMSGGTVTPYEFIKQVGAAASYTTVGDVCAPYAIDIEVSNVTPCGTDDDETILLPEFRMDRIEGGFKDAMLKVTGRCNSKAVTATRF